MATSLAVAPLLLTYTDEVWVRLGLMALASTGAAVAAALLGPRTDEATRVAFYRRVRPAGWWCSTAVASGEEAAKPLRKLTGELATTGIAAASLFLMLVGAGKTLVPAPGDTRVVWVLAALAGLALVPLWARRLRPAGPAT